MILTNITSLLLFLQDICGILEMWAAQKPHSLFNSATSSSRSRSRFLLAKQLGFCISVAGGRGNLHYPTCSSKLSSLTMTFTLGMSLSVRNYTGRGKPANIDACHSIHQHHQLCPSEVPLKGLAMPAAEGNHRFHLQRVTMEGLVSIIHPYWIQ